MHQMDVFINILQMMMHFVVSIRMPILQQISQAIFSVETGEEDDWICGINVMEIVAIQTYLQHKDDILKRLDSHQIIPEEALGLQVRHTQIRRICG